MHERSKKERENLICDAALQWDQSVVHPISMHSLPSPSSPRAKWRGRSWNGVAPEWKRWSSWNAPSSFCFAVAAAAHLSATTTADPQWILSAPRRHAAQRNGGSNSADAGDRSVELAADTDVAAGSNCAEDRARAAFLTGVEPDCHSVLVVTEEDMRPTRMRCRFASSFPCCTRDRSESDQTGPTHRPSRKARFVARSC